MINPGKIIVEGNTCNGSFVSVPFNNEKDARSFCYDMGIDPIKAIKIIEKVRYI